MNVLLADSAGACYGVKRAIGTTLNAADGSHSVQTLGPLIHNPQFVSQLEQKGISVAESPEDVSSERIVIRSHGVTPDVLELLAELNTEVIDATCPHVLRAQKAAYELAASNHNVIVVGEKEHPEVAGLAAWAEKGGKKAIVVRSAEELPNLLEGPVGIVVQTTQPRHVLDEIITSLKLRGIETTVKDTICSSTSKRQKAAEELSQKVDAMVVIGGKNSSNTTRLYELCSRHIEKTFHIEKIDELKAIDFLGIKTVGVTAGASTPDDQIEAVVDYLHSL